MRQEISIIVSRLKADYFEKQNQQENITYEDAVNLNAQMLEKALQMYHQKLMERERRLFR
jgi:hypothetical protein